MLEKGEVQAAAHTLGFDVVTLDIRRAEDIAPAFEALKGRAEALYVVGELLINTNRVQYQHLVAESATADDAPCPGARRSGRSDVLWTELSGPFPARR